MSMKIAIRDLHKSFGEKWCLPGSTSTSLPVSRSP
jgi:hypothetical protein